MRRTQRELTDVEIKDTFFKLVDLICDSYNHPVRKEFQKSSRAAQIGYDSQRVLLDAKIIEIGERFRQERLDIDNEQKNQKEEI